MFILCGQYLLIGTYVTVHLYLYIISILFLQISSDFKQKVAKTQ